MRGSPLALMPWAAALILLCAACASSGAMSVRARAAVPAGVSHSSRRRFLTVTRARSSDSSGARRLVRALSLRRSCPVVRIGASSRIAVSMRAARCPGRDWQASAMTRARARSMRPASRARRVPGRTVWRRSARSTRVAAAFPVTFSAAPTSSITDSCADRTRTSGSSFSSSAVRRRVSSAIAASSRACAQEVWRRAAAATSSSSASDRLPRSPVRSGTGCGTGGEGSQSATRNNG